MTEFRSSRRIRPLPGLMAIPVLALGLALAGWRKNSWAWRIELLDIGVNPGWRLRA